MAAATHPAPDARRSQDVPGSLGLARRDTELSLLSGGFWTTGGSQLSEVAGEDTGEDAGGQLSVAAAAELAELHPGPLQT